ncbi:MAG: CAP domain-containing protein [Myxococcota bacterium]
MRALLALVPAIAALGCGPQRAQVIGKTPDPSSTIDVCKAYNKLSTAAEGPFAGNIQSCAPGAVDPGSAASALLKMNTYRSFLGLPAVSADAALNAKAQACALMMDANDALSHMPPANWRCYSPEGAQGAGSSNISTGPIVESIDGFMLDPGNETTIGHRRWILSNGLRTVGFGSAPGGSCLWIIHPMSGDRDFSAWPPPGPFPSGLLSDRFSRLDQTGWTIQSDVLDLAGATVSIHSDGADLPIDQTDLLPGYGSGSAIKMTPKGWSSTIGKKYTVRVEGLPMALEYTVEIVDCAS